jgi:hypothetical protein
MRFALISLLFLLSFTRTHAADPELKNWVLRNDFRSSPNQSNPNPDHYGSPDTWKFMQANSTSHAPSSYSLYKNYVLNFGSIPGLEAWTNRDFPEVSINTSGRAITANGANLPAGAVFSHPASGNFSVIAWKSPAQSTFQVSAAFADVHVVCGDGFEWSIDRGNGSVSSIINTGIQPNGGAASFQTTLDLNEGDFLYFIVGPKADQGCDTTQVDVNISGLVTPSPSPSPTPTPAQWANGAARKAGQLRR